jgi:DNA-binding NarL/FixJ family response regulator
VIEPLRKRKLDGTLYTRPADVEGLLPTLAALPIGELVARCAITDRSDPLYVPSECVLHFVRAWRSHDEDSDFARLYRLLLARVERLLPRVADPDGKTESRAKVDVRDAVLHRFASLLVSDLQEYDDRLDFYEARFSGAVARLRLSAQETAWQDERRFEGLELEQQPGELAPHVESAAGSVDPFDTTDADAQDFRLRVYAAIDTLPPEQRQVLHMLRQGFPIDSKDPSVMTIAKALNRSGRTIQTYRDRAFAALQQAFAPEAS